MYNSTILSRRKITHILRPHSRTKIAITLLSNCLEYPTQSILSERFTQIGKKCQNCASPREIVLVQVKDVEL